MPLDREDIYGALYQRLQDKVPSIVQWSRKELNFDDVADNGCPACVMLITDQSAELSDHQGLPPKWRLGAALIIYARASGNLSPDEVLNHVLDEIEAALERQPGEPIGVEQNWETNLGGRVQRVYYTGVVTFVAGTQGGVDGSVIVPVEMLATVP